MKKLLYALPVLAAGLMVGCSDSPTEGKLTLEPPSARVDLSMLSAQGHVTELDKTVMAGMATVVAARRSLEAIVDDPSLEAKLPDLVPTGAIIEAIATFRAADADHQVAVEKGIEAFKTGV